MQKLPLRHILLGIATVTGIAKRGYFIPYRYASQVVPDTQPYPWLESWFSDLLGGRFQETLESIHAHRDILKTFNAEPPAPPAPRWRQDWFPGLDGAAAYALVRRAKPRRIVEIGSGHSTRFVMRAVRDGDLGTRVTCVDPAPRADLEGLNLDLLRMPVQQVDPALIGGLEAGDMLIIDSSHIVMPGSDVDWVLNRLLPMLPAGVLVHFHDIFLPDPYPESWDWRGYNEHGVVSALLAGRRAVPIFASHFIRSRAQDRLEAMDLDWIPLLPGAYESSLWLELR